jgi:hypothetical protein
MVTSAQIASSRDVTSRMRRSILRKLANELFTKTAWLLKDSDARAAVGNVTGSDKSACFARDLFEFAPGPGSPSRPGRLGTVVLQTPGRVGRWGV